MLVRGKPGTGKSQMARTIAEQLGWAFVSEVVRGSTELNYLHWHFDAIGRLGEAQARAISDTDTSDKDKLDPLNFLSPGAFWWAFNWKSAEGQYGICCRGFGSAPEKPDTNNKKGKAWKSETGGVVLLIDEIDKAEPDLPNGLLEPLGLYQFTVPYINRLDNSINPIKAEPSRLLVIITTNEERELPKAFVRRCFVHTLKMEESTEQITVDKDKAIEKRYQWLIDRGQLHFGEVIAEPVYQMAAELLWQDRSDSQHGQYPPGLAEYIDLLSALQSLSHQEQQKRLEKIAKYALKKDLG